MSFKEFTDFRVFEWRDLPFTYTRHLYLPYGEDYGDPEGALNDTIREGEKAVVEGGGGSGKTSLINYVLSGLTEEFLPIAFPVRPSSKNDNKLSSATDFCAFMLSRIKMAMSTFRMLEVECQTEDFETFRK